MAARIILPYRKVLKRPVNPNIPLFPKTLGDHIRKKRMESGLLQREVAELLSVSEDTVTFWENGRTSPTVSKYPKIIDFLDYYPFDHEVDSIAGRLKKLRHYLGFTYDQFGNMLEVNGTTVREWEFGKRPLRIFSREIIEKLWAKFLIQSKG